ncbi:MAG: recombinase RecA [bacterium]|nr:recombinase RecA [bacterium]
MAKQKQEISEKNDKDQALDLALTQIEREFGKGSIMKLGANNILGVDVISTGILPLDLAIGVGGVPKGRITEIYGPESSGKTTLSLNVVANAQKCGGVAAFIDAEHALDPVYAKKLGVDIDNLLVSQPDDGEQAMEITETLVRSNAIDVIVVDSVAALVPRAEIEGSMTDQQMGLQARLMSKALRKLTSSVSKSNTSVIFINQLREKIGVMFGNPETTTGGRALKFYSSLRMDIRRISTLKKGDHMYGNRVRVKVVKNKVAPPFRQTEFDMYFDRGIVREGCIIEAGVEHGIVAKAGSWFLYGDIRLGQGREKATIYLEENPEIANEIEDKVLCRGQFSPDAINEADKGDTDGKS